MVIGDRMDNIHPGAMPWLHRYVGNPVLTGILNLFFRTGVKDAHCGMRAVRRDVLPRARPAHHRHGVRLGDGDPRRQGGPRRSASSRSSTTRAAASRSSRASATAGATCASCSCTARRTCSSLPGAVLAVLGALDRARPCSPSSSVFGREWDLHAMIAGALLMIVGAQVVALGLCAHAYGTYFMGEQGPLVRPHARPLPARARAAARRRDRCWPGCVIGGVIVGQSGSTAASAQLSEERARGAGGDARSSSASRSSSPSSSRSSACAAGPTRASSLTAPAGSSRSPRAA